MDCSKAIIELSKFGTVKTCKSFDHIVTICVVKDSTKNPNAINGMEMMEYCRSYFVTHPIIETVIVEPYFFLLVLKSLKSY
jgi:hypothetical protein